jgi:hypothetical protein
MWESCPNCGRLAAVGWLDGYPIQVDCPNGCSVDPARVVSTFRFRPTDGLPAGADRGSLRIKPR